MTHRTIRTAWIVGNTMLLAALFAVVPPQSKTPLLVAALAAAWVMAVRLCRTQRTPNAETMLAGSVLLAAGVVGDLRVLMAVAGAVWLVAGTRRVAGVILVAATIGWLPASDYVFGGFAVPVRVTSAALLPLAVALKARTVGLPARRAVGPVLTVVGVVLAAGIVVGQDDSPSLLTNLPTTGLFYRSQPIELTDAEAKHLAKATVAKRRYALPCGRFDLLAIDGADDRHAVHDPTFCHRGAGWVVANRQTLPLKNGQAALVQYNRGRESTQCVYWFTNGISQKPDAWWYWAQATLRRLTGGQSGREPVLVVLQPSDETAPDWSAVMRECPALAAF